MARVPLARVVEAVRAHRPDEPGGEGDVKGAVLVALTSDEEATLLLTERARRAARFPGEISFPGGYRERGDDTLLQTALRETWEEVAVVPDQVEVVGRLDDRYVYGRTHVRPFVGVLAPDAEPVADPGEVAGIFTVPLAEFLAPDVYEGRSMREPEKAGVERVVHYFRVGSWNVWGATGRMVAELLELALDWRPPSRPRVVDDPAEFARDL